MKRRKILLVDESFEFLEQVSGELDAVADTIVAVDSIEALSQLCQSTNFDLLIVGSRLRPVTSVTLAHVFHELQPDGAVCFLVDGADGLPDFLGRPAIPGASFVARADLASYVLGESALSCSI
ncbi:MAG: hypothetical protein JST16_02985 [Bdellovibrionales bacterium]|nr:hypothetical protein [Bdellovibrionales bacterium]